MTTETEQRNGASPVAGHSPDQYRPIGSYGVLTGCFFTMCALFSVWMRRSNRKLPDRLDTRDMILIAVAGHKLSRLIARDRVTSAVRAPFTEYQESGGPAEVKEKARGRGLRRAIGELIICPYCLDVWVTTALVAGMIVAPRPTRWIASAFTSLFGSDMLQIAYVKAQQMT